MLSIFSLLVPLLASATLLKTAGEAGALEGVKLPATAKLEAQGRSTDLSSASFGLRNKKVVFVKVKVYVGQLLVSEPATFVKHKGKCLDSVSASKAAALQMTFLRDVDAGTLQSAFRDSFKDNKVPLENEAIQKFLAAVKGGGEAKEGKTITVAAERVGKRELITYEGTNGQAVTIDGPEGLRRQIFSLWLGEPADSGVEHLQEGLCGA